MAFIFSSAEYNKSAGQESVGNKSFLFGTIRQQCPIAWARTKLKMPDTFNSQHALLKLLEPANSVDKQSDFLRQLLPEQWALLLVEANRQGVTPLLYPALVREAEVGNLGFLQKEQLHQTYLSTAVRNTLILRDAEVLLASLQKSAIATAGLKGIYLLEHVYYDIGARAMNDIDILIRKQDLPKALGVMRELGYMPTTYFSLDDENTDTKHVPPMQKAGGALVELHWTLLEEKEPFTIDPNALWERVIPAKIADVDALALGVEDLVLHLCLHLTYQHYLQLGLRGLLDIAMVIHKFNEEIDWQKLVQIAKSWGSERVTALTLKLVETQLSVPIPPEVYSAMLSEPLSPDLLENARSLLLDRVDRPERLTPDLVELNARKSLFSKLKIGLQRVFIPRLALARIYNVPPDSPRILGLYWLRLKYLIRNYGGTLRRLQGGKNSAPALQRAETSYSLHEWMTGHHLEVGRD